MSLLAATTVLLQQSARTPAAFRPAAASRMPAVVEPSVPIEPAGARADADLDRTGRSPIAGGLLTLPPSFESSDGKYDLVIHFHGNTDLVEESFAVAKVNAAVVIFNLGNGSGPYEDRFNNSMSLPQVTARVREALEQRGLRNPAQRRLALSAWSAGYGAVVRILEQPVAETVDAVLLLDGIHAGYLPHSRELNTDKLVPFEKFAEKAVRGERLMLITHSEIDPMTYAGTHKSTDALLKSVGVERHDGGQNTKMPELESIQGVIPKKMLLELAPLSEASSAGLHVHGYAGEGPEHHMAHLVQMASIALPDLVERWQRPRL